jgi:protein TonB
VYNTATELMLNPKLSLLLFSVALVLFAAGCNKPAAPAPANAAPQSQNANAPVPPHLLRGVHAEFPKELWSKPGTVAVAAVVGTDGKVGETKIVSSPHPELNPLAINAVKQWQFDPARQAGKPIPSTVTVNVNFQPPADGKTAPAQKPLK